MSVELIRWTNQCKEKYQLDELNSNKIKIVLLHQGLELNLSDLFELEN